MKVFRKKRTYVVTAILLCVITVIAVFAYSAYPMVRYSAYNTEEREKYPRTFILKSPIHIIRTITSAYHAKAMVTNLT